ncbi:hypothetical protein [Breoghania sp.]|uniref:hypothetical protein n=1 Tax=Breoghania sp. TaxID=2065378 RepID=UPI00262057B6|nr:hypothetical protein [Breoghania sp.]MDJ0931895.1 hypothetical protein [Breoghania sp.]
MARGGVGTTFPPAIADLIGDDGWPVLGRSQGLSRASPSPGGTGDWARSEELYEEEAWRLLSG